MFTMKQYTFPVVILIFGAFLSACSNSPYIRSAPTHIAYRDAPASVLNRGWISGSSMHALNCMRLRGTTTPATDNERIAVAERELFRAKKHLKSSSYTATTHYLRAAETLWPVVRDHANPGKRAYWGDKKRLIIAHQLYTHAVGQTTQLLIKSHALNPQQNTVQLGDQTLTLNTSQEHTLHPSYFDSISPLDTHTYGCVGPKHYTTTGLGAPIVGHRVHTDQRATKTPLLPPHGMDLPVNVIIDYPSSGRPRLTLTNLLKTDTTTITGQTRPLAADYSSSVAAMMSTQSSILGIRAAINPDKYKNKEGLFALGPYDPEKIPVIFIHGLISQPSTWARTTNHLLGDKTIRENYQIYYYFYSTGVTPALSGANLRKTLNKFYKSHDREAHDQLNRTVLVGHSMGGILSSIQSREFSQELWNSIFKNHNLNDPSDKKSIQEYRNLFDPPILKPIERTIFVSTPHLGSELADGWIGRIGMALITLPQNILSLQLDATVDSMTELGRSLVNSDGAPNSISRLKANNPTLKLLNDQPISPRVTYHSIIGDRGKNDTPESSDGVVPYWSSHLDGATSEKIVPTHHEAQLHPETNQEISRILHLHLKKGKK